MRPPSSPVCVSLGLAIAIALTVSHGRVLEHCRRLAAARLARRRVPARRPASCTRWRRSSRSATSASMQGSPGFGGFAKRYYALLNLFAVAMLLVPLAADFGTLWVAVELTTIVSALLVAIDRTDAALEAAWKYVLIASSGLGIALLSIIILYATGTHALGSAYIPRFADFFAHAHGLSPDAVRAGVRAGGRRVRHQGRVRADAHVAARRPQRGAGTGLGDAVRVAAVGSLLRDPPVLPGRRRDRRPGVRRARPDRLRCDLAPRRELLRAPPVQLQAAARLLLDRAHGRSSPSGSGSARRWRSPARCCT